MLERMGVLGQPPQPALPGRSDASSRQNLILLLIQLRWIAVAGQIVTIVVVQSWLGIGLPLPAMFAVIGALVLLNVASLVWLRGHPDVDERGLLLSLILDVAALTAQLSLSGGATNPFIFLYILQVTLAAVLLRTRPTIGVVLLTCACFVGVTVYHRPIALPPDSGLDRFGLYIDGLLVCFALDAALLVAFVSRITRNLRARDAHLAALRQRAAEEDHIVRMGLLASGAAHELGTPLSSLSVILGDWRRMPAFSGNPELAPGTRGDAGGGAALQIDPDRHPHVGRRSTRRGARRNHRQPLPRRAGRGLAQRPRRHHLALPHRLRRRSRDRPRHGAEAGAVQRARQCLRGVPELGRASRSSVAV